MSQPRNRFHAIRLYEQLLKQRERQLGPDHPSTLIAFNNLANAYTVAGRTAEAIPLHEQTLTLRELKLGPDHRDAFQSCHNLASVYAARFRSGR